MRGKKQVLIVVALAVLSVLPASTQVPATTRPHVFLQAPESGQSLTWGADRKQFKDFASEFARSCAAQVDAPDLKLAQPDIARLGLVNQKRPDFLVVMSRYDAGFKRHTRIQVFDQAGALVSDRDALNMKSQAKSACEAIEGRWSRTVGQ